MTNKAYDYMSWSSGTTKIQFLEYVRKIQVHQNFAHKNYDVKIVDGDEWLCGMRMRVSFLDSSLWSCINK